MVLYGGQVSAESSNFKIADVAKKDEADGGCDTAFLTDRLTDLVELDAR